MHGGEQRYQPLRPAFAAGVGAVDRIGENLSVKVRRTAVKQDGIFEAVRLEKEVQNLISALAHGRAADTLTAAIESRKRELDDVHTQITSLSRPAVPINSKPWTEEDVEARYDQLWDDLNGADREKARCALVLIFDEIIVEPLDGSWEKGWTLRMKTRPWAFMVPTGGVRMSLVAGARCPRYSKSGGRSASVGSGEREPAGRRRRLREERPGTLA